MPLRTSTAASSLRRWIAPDAIALINAALRRGVRFTGEYASWDEAAEQASGYQETGILDRAIAATEEVRSGRASYDRDGIAFTEPDHAFPLLAGLFHAAFQAGGKLSVLDLGGGLGSTYFQCRPWLTTGRPVSWTVVEQEHYVKAGRSRFESSELHFAHSIAEATKRFPPNVAVLSSVLQYLPDPAAILKEMVETGVQAIIINRTPVINAAQSIITVQRVPARIVKSSYPARLFARDDLLGALGGKYRLLAEYDDLQDGPILSLGRLIRFKGFINSRW